MCLNGFCLMQSELAWWLEDSVETYWRYLILTSRNKIVSVFQYSRSSFNNYLHLISITTVGKGMIMFCIRYVHMALVVRAWNDGLRDTIKRETCCFQ